MTWIFTKFFFDVKKHFLLLLLYMVGCFVLFASSICFFHAICNSCTTDQRVTGWKRLFWVEGLKVYTAYSYQQRCMLKPCLIIPCLFCLRCDSQISAVAGFPSEHNNRSRTISDTLMRVIDGRSSVTIHPLLGTKTLLYCTLNHMHVGNSDA